MEDFSGFDHEQDGSASPHQRIAQRDSMFLQARASRPDMPDAVLRLRNLSAGGMMADSEQGFASGETLTVDLRGVGPVRGRVVWVKPPRIGIAFDYPINPKLARKAPPQSPGSGLLLLPAARSAKRPALR